MSPIPGQPPLNWGTESLWLTLEPLLPGLTVEVVAQIGSTNTELLARARQSPADALKPALLVAEQQTAGRGRQGKAWQSAAGSSLTFSLALPLAMTDWSGLSLAVGLALAEALDPAPADPAATPRLGLKWPNDLILLEDGGHAPHIGRKLGGILIETVQVGTSVDPALPGDWTSTGAGLGAARPWERSARIAVIGMGLNIRPQPAGVAPDTAAPQLNWGFGCVQELQPGLDAPAVLALVATPLVRALQAFEARGFAPLQPAFARRDVLAGREVNTTLPGLPQGRADGVDGGGTLWLRNADGRHPVASGEVSLQPAAAAGPAGASSAPC